MLEVRPFVGSGRALGKGETVTEPVGRTALRGCTGAMEAEVAAVRVRSPWSAV